MPNKKVCTKCLKKKSLEEFSGSPHCSLCRVPYFRKYNEKRYASPEARALELKRAREKYHRLYKNQRLERKALLISFFGGKCKACGYKRCIAALDFHHRNPKSKRRALSHLLAINQPWAWKAAIREAKKCDVLCSNCHREKTFLRYMRPSSVSASR